MVLIRAHETYTRHTRTTAITYEGHNGSVSPSRRHIVQRIHDDVEAAVEGDVVLSALNVGVVGNDGRVRVEATNGDFSHLQTCIQAYIPVRLRTSCSHTHRRTEGTQRRTRTHVRY